MASFLLQANTARRVDQTERAYTTRTSRVLNVVGKPYGAGLSTEEEGVGGWGGGVRLYTE